MKELPAPNRRILLIDDNPAIHEDFRRILLPDRPAAEIDAEAARVFGLAPVEMGPAGFTVDSALQGEEALALAAAACAEGRPYALAFVDMRMPPGWDGLTTIRKLWEVDEGLQVVICTAYSDHGWGEIQEALSAGERWLVLKKPFDKIEALQLANCLTEKWTLGQRARLERANLEEAVGLRTEQLQRSIRIKNEFLTNLSHELLTPMNGVLGLLQALQGEVPSADGQSYLRDAESCGQELLRQLRRILVFNQAESGALPLEPVIFNPRALVAGAIKAFRARSLHKGLVLTAEIDPDCDREICAPASIIGEILSVIVDNAVKFTARGSVVIRSSRDRQHLWFTVEDTGVGMTHEQIELISLPFAQVDGGLSRRSSGLGLGLPMAKRLTSSLGGTLTMNRRAEAGLSVRFSVLLSLEPVRQTA